MPAISRFKGIVIYMYWEEGERHHTPHLHARYQGKKAAYSITSPIECLAGSLPGKVERSVIMWIELHQDELLDNWHKMQAYQAPNKISPLN